MELGFFERVGEVARQGVPGELGELHHRAHRGGVKAWYGEETAAKEHYEAQLVSRLHVDGQDGAVLEVGFHAENRDEASNQATLDALLAEATSWDDSIGPVLVNPEVQVHDKATADVFLGNDSWRRLSETWDEFDTEDAELSFEAGARLAEYITAIEPALRSQRSTSALG